MIGNLEDSYHQVVFTIFQLVPPGDLLGPVMGNLEDLLRMPYGCGEQNMLYFAPNVFLIDYLKRTDTYTPELAEKAENYMLVGAYRGLVRWAKAKVVASCPKTIS